MSLKKDTRLTGISSCFDLDLIQTLGEIINGIKFVQRKVGGKENLVYFVRNETFDQSE